MNELAIAKIDKELAAMGNCGQKESAVKSHVARTLKEFCGQDAEFAQAVVQTEKTLGECCKKIMQDCGTSISDVEVYRRAVQFYFPGADIRVKMTIDLCASVYGNSEPEPVTHAIDLDLTSFL